MVTYEVWEYLMWCIQTTKFSKVVVVKVFKKSLSLKFIYVREKNLYAISHKKLSIFEGTEWNIILELLFILSWFLLAKDFRWINSGTTEMGTQRSEQYHGTQRLTSCLNSGVFIGIN